MNEILQKRIEEAAEKYAYTNWENDDYHEGAEEGVPFDPIGHLEKCFKEATTFALQNQWISVDERLPKDKEDVFVRNEYGGCTAAWYSRKTKDWHLTCGEICGDDIISSKITHWMCIPGLEGGEE